MSSVVSQYVTKILCGNQGCLDFKQLDQIVGQKFTVADEVLLGILCDRGKYAISKGEGKASRLAMSQNSVIVAKTSLRVCQSPPGDCLHCENLHLCRYFVCGNCRFGNKCKNAHSLDSTHNTALIRSVGHHDLGEAELFPLLLQNDPYLMPEICSHYNKGVGEHGSCKFKTSCTSLHLCLHFLQGDCKFGAGCKRAHTFDATTLKILNGRGFSQENIRILDKIYNNKFIIIGQGHEEKPSVVVPSPAPAIEPVGKERSRKPSSRSISETDRNEICLFFIRRHCSFKEKCVRIHYHLPYKWQILERDGVTWRDLPNVEEIEKAYCIPGKDTRYSCHHIRFIFYFLKYIKSYLMYYTRLVTHSIWKWSDEADAKIQECFASTDWNMFRDSSDGIEEFTTSVTGFINKCIDDVIPTVTIPTYTNQKPWIKGNILTELKARAAAFLEWDTNPDAYKKSRYTLRRTIKQAVSIQD